MFMMVPAIDGAGGWWPGACEVRRWPGWAGATIVLLLLRRPPAPVWEDRSCWAGATLGLLVDMVPCGRSQTVR
jgi:hypothetical protein